MRVRVCVYIVVSDIWLRVCDMQVVISGDEDAINKASDLAKNAEFGLPVRQTVLANHFVCMCESQEPFREKGPLLGMPSCRFVHIANSSIAIQ